MEIDLWNNYNLLTFLAAENNSKDCYPFFK